MFDLSELNDIVLCFNRFTGGKDSGFVEFQHDNFFSSVVVVGENVFLIPYSALVDTGSLSVLVRVSLQGRGSCPFVIGVLVLKFVVWSFLFE